MQGVARIYVLLTVAPSACDHRLQAGACEVPLPAPPLFTLLLCSLLGGLRRRLGCRRLSRGRLGRVRCARDCLEQGDEQQVNHDTPLRKSAPSLPNGGEQV